MPSIRFSNPAVMPMRFAGFTTEAKRQIAASEEDLDALKTLYVKTTDNLMACYRNAIKYRGAHSSNESLANDGFVSKELHLLQLLEVIRLVDHPVILNAVYETIDTFDDGIEFGHSKTLEDVAEGNEIVGLVRDDEVLRIEPERVRERLTDRGEHLRDGGMHLDRLLRDVSGHVAPSRSSRPSAGRRSR